MLRPISEVPSTIHRIHTLCKLLFQLCQKKSPSKGDRLVEKEAVGHVPFSPGFSGRMFCSPKVFWGLASDHRSGDLEPFYSENRVQDGDNQSFFLSIRHDDWMFSMYLKDVYLQVPIHPDSRYFFRFVCQGIEYQFKVLAVA